MMFIFTIHETKYKIQLNMFYLLNIMCKVTLLVFKLDDNKK
jgi:hypothetical protein